MVAWLVLWLWPALLCAGQTASQKTHAGLVIHEVPEYYEADGRTLKPSSGKQAIRLFTGRPEWGPAADVMGFVFYLLKEVVRDINGRADVLPDYVVELHLSNSLCDPKVARQTTVEAISRNPEGFFHMIFGPGCSGAVAAVNDLIQPFRLMQIASLSDGPFLADRSRYPYMCRTSPPLHFASAGIARMCKLFGWSRIGSVSDGGGLAKSTVGAFLAEAEAEASQGYAFDLEWMASASQVVGSAGEAARAVWELRHLGAKVVVLALYEDLGVRFLCEMYLLGYYGSMVQTLLATAWWTDNWIRENAMHASDQCTVEQLLEAGTGMIKLGQATFLPSTTLRHGITGSRLSEIKATYFKLCRDPNAEGCSDVASSDYDGLALAVHILHVWLYEHGHRLSEIDYRNKAAQEQLFQIAVNSTFIGTSGEVSFFNDSVMACERRGTFSIEQYQPFATDWGDYVWEDIASYRDDVGFGTFLPWRPIKWADGTETLFGEGSGFGDLVAAPGTKQSFGTAVGLENIPDDRLDCPVGHRPTADRSGCEECPEGTAADSIGSWECQPCGGGTFASARGSGSCSFCPPGTYQESPGASFCVECPVGTASDPVALWRCLSCSPGSFTVDTGQSECSRCPLGSYSDHQGMTGCVECEGLGMTTTYMATTSQGACHCAEGMYRDREGRDCRDCPEGMLCQAGSDMLNFPAYVEVLAPTVGQRFPLLRRGYMSVGTEPLSVYVCMLEEHCPGPIPGRACATGREGIACGRCRDGYAESSVGRCDQCDPRSTALPSVIVGIAAMLVVALSTLNVNTNWNTRSSAVVLFLTIAGITVVNLQTMAVFRRSALHWKMPLTAILQAVSIASFEIDGLKASCVLGSDPVRHYIVRQCLVPMCVPIVLATVLIKRRWVPASMEDVVVQVGNTLGTLCNLFFISILVSAVSSMYCYAHPGGHEHSMVSDPSILCFNSSSHIVMLIITCVAVLCVPVPYAAMVLVTTYHYPSMVTSNSPRSLLIMRSMRFLFFRFHRRCYYYGMIVLARSFFICLVPVVFGDYVGLQIAFFCATLGTFTLVQQQLSPWLSTVANVVDGILAQLMATMLVSGVMATPDLKDSAGVLGLTAFVILSLLACAILVYVTWQVSSERRKFYQMFICHHKAAAAAQARYLKTLLEQATGRSIFIDSDDLKDLQQLFDIVRTQVRHLLVYLTRFTMGRPWCAGEIATAMATGVGASGVVTPSFQRPEEAMLRDPAEMIEDFATCSLEEHGVTFEMLAEGLTQFLDQDNFIEIRSQDRGRGRLNSVVAQLVGRQASTGCGTIPVTPGSVVISADPADDEGIAAAAILAGYIKLEVVRRTWVQICFLADHEEDLEALSAAVLSSTALLVLLSSGSLESLPQLVAIVEVMAQMPGLRQPKSGYSSPPSKAPPPRKSTRQRSVQRFQEGPCVIPVNIPGFIAPQKGYYERELPRIWPGRASHAQECIKLFFERIAISFPVHASDKVISSHTEDILERIDYTRKRAPSGTDSGPSKQVRSWAEVPDDSTFEPVHRSSTVSTRMQGIGTTDDSTQGAQGSGDSTSSATPPCPGTE